MKEREYVSVHLALRVCVNVRVRVGLCERVRGWLSARDGKKARERDEKMISE